MNEDKITQLAQARKLADEAAALKKSMLESLTKSPEYIGVEELAKRRAADVEELEKEIKAEYESAFDGDKKPHPAIQLKEFDITAVEYDAQKAHAWCVQNFTPALKLDKAAFEKAAKAGSIPAEIAEVKPGKEIRAQIATDLSAYL